MAKFDYIRAQNTALGLIDKFGQKLKIVRVDNSEYDPISGAVSNPTLYQTDSTVVTLPAGSGNSSFDNRFKEELKAGKIRFFYVAAKGLSFAPKQGDHLLFENGVWDIAGTTPLNPAGTPVLYTLGCRVGNISSFEGIISDMLDETPTAGGLTFEGLEAGLAQLADLEPRVSALELDQDDDVETLNTNW